MTFDRPELRELKQRLRNQGLTSQQAQATAVCFALWQVYMGRVPSGASELPSLPAASLIQLHDDLLKVGIDISVPWSENEAPDWYVRARLRPEGRTVRV